MVTLNEAGISGVVPVSAIMVTVLPFLVVSVLVTAIVILIFLDVPILHDWIAFTEKFDTFRSIELKALEHGLGLHGIMGFCYCESWEWSQVRIRHSSLSRTLNSLE